MKSRHNVLMSSPATHWKNTKRQKLLSVSDAEVWMCLFYCLIPVVLHKAVAEVSGIGNL